MLLAPVHPACMASCGAGDGQIDAGAHATDGCLSRNLLSDGHATRARSKTGAGRVYQYQCVFHTCARASAVHVVRAEEVCKSQSRALQLFLRLFLQLCVGGERRVDGDGRVFYGLRLRRRTALRSRRRALQGGSRLFRKQTPRSPRSDRTGRDERAHQLYTVPAPAPAPVLLPAGTYPTPTAGAGMCRCRCRCRCRYSRENKYSEY